MEKLDLSKRKEPKPEIKLDVWSEVFGEMVEPSVPVVKKERKKVEVKEHSKQLNNKLSLNTDTLLKKEEPVIVALPEEEFLSSFTDAIAPEGYEVPTFEEEVVEEPEEEVVTEVEEVVEEEITNDKEEVIEEVVEEPEEVTEDVIEEPEEPKEDPMMKQLSDQLSRLYKKENKEELTTADQAAAILERKVALLERQLYETRRMVMEIEPGTIVSGLGGAHSGGGEVNLKRMDDVSVSNIQDGDGLVWDATLQQFIPDSAGGDLNLSAINRSVWRLQEKFISMDERVQAFLKTDTRLLKLEDNTAEAGTEVSREPRTFIDEVADGDTTTFVVTQDPSRNVYEMDGIPQPTIQVPRGDIIIFDISGLDDPSSFDVFQNGVVLQTGYTRDNTSGSESITVATGSVSTDYNKLYYRHTTINGYGWIIQITDH